MSVTNIFYLNLILFWAAIFSSIYVISNYLRRKNAVEELRANLELSIDNSVPMLLDSIIQECFEEYMVLNEEYKDEPYITKDREEEIMKGVGNLTANRMSKSLQTKLTTYYDADAIEKVISDKIYILVMNNSIEANDEKEDSEEL